MVAKYSKVLLSAAIILSSGCTDLTEFDHSISAGVNVFSTPDLSVIHTVEGIPAARSVCWVPGSFIVATTEGKAKLYDLETFEQTGSYTIGTPSSSGYFEMEYSPKENSVYIIGAFGQIYEFSVPDMELTDSFSPCETPVDIEIGVQVELPYFYVAGATSNRIYELTTGSNLVTRSCQLYSSPTCMAISQAQDTILVGTIEDTEIVSIVSPTMMHRIIRRFPSILAIEPVPDDTTYCTIFGYSTTGIIATVLRYFPDEPGGGGNPEWTGTEPVDGELFCMCVDYEGSHAYVLSYLGNSTSSLVSYNCSNYMIENQIELQGYPLDIDISNGGSLLVLTAQ